MRTDILEREGEIRAWIEDERPKAYICRRLKCKPETLNSYLKKFGIAYSGNQGSRGQKPSPHKKSALEYLGTDYPKSHTAKLKLIEEHRCEKCGRVEWMESKIPLELHHRNGNHHDWNLENLEILCPNCHAQEPNNSGAARKVMPR